MTPEFSGDQLVEWLRADPIRPEDAPTAAGWAAIATRIDRERERRLARRRAIRYWTLGASVAAAAVVALLLWNEPQMPQMAPMVSVSNPSPAYRLATEELETLLRTHRSELQPGTIRALESSLAMIDSAIVQAERALAADPASDYVSRSLERLRDDRLTTLREIAALVRL